MLAGHPYHLDPLVNHGIPALIESMGVPVVTEDAVAHLAPQPEHLDVVNQWTFHSRLYRAASLVLRSPQAELVQLVSFGCGIDAITSEQVKRLLEPSGKIFTMLKIDEGEALGSVKIRLRSLLAAVESRRTARRTIPIELVRRIEPKKKPRIPPSSGIRTLYAPQMAPVHFPILAGALQSLGWNVRILPEVRPQAIELGLAHVNNDACYPAIIVIGQLLDALKNGEIDPERSALLLAQTCGPCRATNYPNLLRWALQEIGCGEIPVVTLAAGKLRGAEQLDIGLRGLHRLCVALVFGDLLQRLSLYVRAHGAAEKDWRALMEKWTARAVAAAQKGNGRAFERGAPEMVRDFLTLPLDGKRRPRVGIVGEILLKYHPKANLNIVDEIIAEGAEPVLGDLSSFLLYCLYDHIYSAKAFGTSKFRAGISWLVVRHLESLRRPMVEALQGTPLEGVASLKDGLRSIQGFVSPGQAAGEGWLLTAEMLDFINTGTENVVCLQPFGCLPNHITGKGVMRRLRMDYPKANLCAVDFEAGTSRSNVANRLKLFLAQAHLNFAQSASVKPD